VSGAGVRGALSVERAVNDSTSSSRANPFRTARSEDVYSLVKGREKYTSSALWESDPTRAASSPKSRPRGLER